MGDVDAIHVLIQALQDHNQLEKVAAADCDVSAVPALIHALTHGDASLIARAVSGRSGRSFLHDC
jgi:hypothetical protein